ncbi:DUF1294 domain-containing protein [Paenibacillaceae bacterium]|nr:DUF1294 domain-containing protein [Paenibacillaceae bacterium]
MTAADTTQEFLIIVLLYVAIMSVILFFYMRHDKKQAQLRRRRVPERQLFVIAILGGGIGGWLGMKVWRHKTKHASFAWGFPVITLLQAAAIGWLFWG